MTLVGSLVHLAPDIGQGGRGGCRVRGAEGAEGGRGFAKTGAHGSAWKHPSTVWVGWAESVVVEGSGKTVKNEGVGHTGGHRVWEASWQQQSCASSGPYYYCVFLSSLETPLLITPG